MIRLVGGEAAWVRGFMGKDGAQRGARGCQQPYGFEQKKSNQ